mgnify:CR=1 FL=1
MPRDSTSSRPLAAGAVAQTYNPTRWIEYKPNGGRYRVDRALAVPTWIEPGSFRVLPIPPTLKDPNLSPGLRSELIASYDRTAAVLQTTPTEGVAIAPRP